MIIRDLDACARAEHDLIVVGGGVYGVALLWEAARLGLQGCLFERGDFGGETSWNSLRILHGGLRYLQSADLPRFYSSVAARREFARDFPDLVEPLSCLMPLYGEGLKRASVMRVAMAANDLLSWRRNAGVRVDQRVGQGRTFSRSTALRESPAIRGPGMQGAACWQDLRMRSSERLLIEMLHRACDLGARATNYVEVRGLQQSQGCVSGVDVQDVETGRDFAVAAPVVVNCAGPLAPRVAAALGHESPDLFAPSIAFNLLLDRPLPGRHALAVAPPRPGAPVYFLVPNGATTLAGTVHRGRLPGTSEARATDEEVRGFVDELGESLPDWGIEARHVVRVFAGLLPAAQVESAELATRVAFVDHAARGGTRGLYSLAGVKFTTARQVAVHALQRIGRKAGWSTRKLASRPAVAVREQTALLTSATSFLEAPGPLAEAAVRACVAGESVRRVSDLVLRRTNWAASAADLQPLEARVRQYTGEMAC